jgi:4-diphosphocytidyl-2-C-methyl-D-erythritol kinase
VKVSQARNGGIRRAGAVEKILSKCQETCRVQTREYKLSSPAKVNIGLSIVGRRENGYHELESLFLPVDFGDELTVSENSESEVQTIWSNEAPFPGTPLPSEKENLVYKTLQLLSLEKKLRVKIEKNIPLGGGLGGGSSNAGSFLKWLVKREIISKARAETAAMQLGADVPFFLESSPSWVTGIGEVRKKVEASSLADAELILLLFPFSCPTKEIFDRYAESGLGFSKPFAGSPQDLSLFLMSAKNDLEPVVAALHPEIKEGLAALRSTAPLYAGLSGSGATCFGVYRTAEDRENAFKVILPLCRKLSCRSIRAKTYKESNNGDHRGQSFSG